MPRWSVYEDGFILNNYNKYDYATLGRLIGRSEKAVSERLRKFGVHKHISYRRWSQNEIEQLFKYYKDGVPPIKIAKLLHRSYNSVVLKAESLGLKRNEYYRPEKYNIEFFTKWSYELAWLVGIVMSDGYVSNPKFGKFIRIAMCDKDVVFNIAKLIGYKGRVVCRDSERNKDVFILTVGGKYIWNFFVNLGITYNKSVELRFPSLPKQYIYSCIRGIFDGDGSISINMKTMYPTARIIGIKDVVYFIIDVIDVPYNLYGYNNNVYTLQYTGERAIAFLSAIYKDSTELTRMVRKYLLYKKLVECDRWQSFI